jgi:hypothetical protein
MNVDALVGASQSQQVVSQVCRLTSRWSGRVRDKVPLATTGARAAQLNR